MQVQLLSLAVQVHPLHKVVVDEGVRTFGKFQVAPGFYQDVYPLLRLLDPRYHLRILP
jgi:hypothetical protein